MQSHIKCCKESSVCASQKGHVARFITIGVVSVTSAASSVRPPLCWGGGRMIKVPAVSSLTPKSPRRSGAPPFHLTPRTLTLLSHSHFRRQRSSFVLPSAEPATLSLTWVHPPLPRPALRPYQTVSTGSVRPRRPRHSHFHNRQDALKVRTHSGCGIMVLKYSRAGSKGPHKQSEAQDDRGPTTLGSRWSPAISLALGSETPHPTVASPIAAAPD